jgi:hypothetical protein
MPQLELGAFPTSAIPTSGTAVTRQADNFIIPTKGWYAAGQGTLLASGAIPYDGINPHRFAVLDDGGGNNYVALSASSGSDLAIVRNANSTLYGRNPVGVLINTLIKGGIAYSSNVYAAFNGTAYTAGSGISIPTMNELVVGGAQQGGSWVLDGWVNRVVYFPTVQPNASLPDYTR